MLVQPLVLAWFACAGAPPPDASVEPDPAPSAPSPSAGDDVFARASNAFAVDLWNHLQAGQAPGTNLVVAPASVSLALAMTATGAVGPTADQMRTVLHADDLDAYTTSAAAQLAAWSASGGPGSEVELTVANRLFGEQTTTFEPVFLAGIADRFGAPLEPVDFVGAPEPARERINGWISEQTKGRIPSLLPADSVRADTRLVLANAVAFDGAWAAAFDPERTTPAPFRAAAGPVDVEMMRQTGTFGYAAVDGVAVLELPYVGDQLVMDVILPAGDAAPGALDAASLDAWLAALAPTAVEVSLPRLSLAPPAVDLVEALSALGMPLAFGGGDFSGMARAEALSVDAVYHQALVVVDEQGTQAAASTAVVVGRGGPAAALPRFVADRPFLFLIRDRTSGTILFLGEVASPGDLRTDGHAG